MTEPSAPSGAPPPDAPRARRVSRGALLMAGSALAFSLMSLLVKVAGRDLPSAQIVLVRALLTLAFSWALVRRAGVPPWGTERRLLWLRGGLGFVALLCFYHGLTRLPLAEATVIQYTSPVFTALLAAAFLGERASPRLWGSTAACLAGVLLVARPAPLFGDRAGGLAPGPAAIALAGAVMSAGAYVVVRRLARTESPHVIVLYFPLVAVPGSLPLVLRSWVWPDPMGWLVLLGVGVTTQVAQVLLTRGLALEPAGRAMSVAYLQIVFAGAWGMLLFGETPDALALAGGALVVAGTLYASLAR